MSFLYSASDRECSSITYVCKIHQNSILLGLDQGCILLDKSYYKSRAVAGKPREAV